MYYTYGIIWYYQLINSKFKLIKKKSTKPTNNTYNIDNNKAEQIDRSTAEVTKSIDEKMMPSKQQKQQVKEEVEPPFTTVQILAMQAAHKTQRQAHACSYCRRPENSNSLEVSLDKFLT